MKRTKKKQFQNLFKSRLWLKVSFHNIPCYFNVSQSAALKFNVEAIGNCWIFSLLNIFLNLTGKYLLYILLDLLLRRAHSSHMVHVLQGHIPNTFSFLNRKVIHKWRDVFYDDVKAIHFFRFCVGFSERFPGGAVSSFLCQIFMTMTLSHQMAEITWKSIKMSVDLARRCLEPRWGRFFAVAQHAWVFSSHTENAATICHSFLVKCRFRLCLTQSTKKKLKLVYLKMLVGTRTEICLRAEMEINVRLIGNFVTFTQLQGKRVRTQTIVVMLEQAWKK